MNAARPIPTNTSQIAAEMIVARRAEGASLTEPIPVARRLRPATPHAIVPSLALGATSIPAVISAQIRR